MSWSIIYISAVIIANYTAIWFIPLPIFGLIAIGTIIFGITFTARDYVHCLGRPRVYTMIAIAALASAVLSVFGPIDWRIILASVMAISLSETADTEIYQRLLAHRWIIRVTGSNVISIPLDTCLFNIIAFAGIFPFPMMVSIILGEIVVKFLVGIIVAGWRMVSKDIEPYTEFSRASI